MEEDSDGMAEAPGMDDVGSTIPIQLEVKRKTNKILERPNRAPSKPKVPKKASSGGKAAKKTLRRPSGVEPCVADMESDEEQPQGANGFVKDQYDWDLNARVSKLTDHNRSLREEVMEKEQQVAELADAVLSLQDELDGERGQNMTGQHLKDISKKNRALKLAVEREKTKNGTLQTEVTRLSQALASSDGSRLPPMDNRGRSSHGERPRTREGGDRRSRRNKEEPVVEEPDWKEKCSQLNGRLMKAGHEARDAKDQLKRALRVLQKEIGDNIPLDKVLEEASGDWRGRAQQVGLLRATVRDLKAKVKAAHDAMGDDRSGGSGSGGPRTPQARTVHDRHQEKIKEIHQQRMQEFDRLVEEQEAALSERDSMKRKVEATRARNRILENELKGMKEKIKILLDKSDGDDQLVDELRHELEVKKKQLGMLAKQGSVRRTQTSELSDARKKLHQKLESHQRTIIALKGELSRTKEVQRAGIGSDVQDWDREEQEHRINMLEVELTKRQELMVLQLDRAQETDRQLLELARKAGGQDQKITALEARLASRVQSRGPTTKKEKEASLVRTLTDKVGSLEAEVPAMREELNRAMHRHRSQLDESHAVSEQVREAHSASTERLRCRLQEIQSTFS